MDGTIKRSSDGIPQYAGEPELLPMYREEAIQYLMTLESHKRYLAGPRRERAVGNSSSGHQDSAEPRSPVAFSSSGDLRAAGFLGVLFGQTYVGGGISLCHEVLLQHAEEERREHDLLDCPPRGGTLGSLSGPSESPKGVWDDNDGKAMDKFEGFFGIFLAWVGMDADVRERNSHGPERGGGDL